MGSARAKAVGVAVCLALVGALSASPGEARADTTQVSGTGKGIVGGALLGGEVGFLGLSVLGAKQSWMYYTIPTALAIGGGIGGYFIEKSADPHVPVYMLAGGMGLVIPTVVVTLSANAYSPGSEDGTPVDAAPTAEAEGKASAATPSATPASTPGPGAGSGSSTTVPPATPTKHKPDKHSRLRQLPFALVNVGDSLRFSVPAVAIRPMYTRTEMAMYGQSQKYEVNAPLLNVAF